MNKVLKFEITDDELEIFLQEVNEHLQALETGVLLLERERDPATLNATFRAAHTLKAVAATVGHQGMTQLTHALESLFDALREGRGAPTAALTDVLLAAIDSLKVLRDEVVTREPAGIDVAAMVAWLEAFVEVPAAKPAVTQGLEGYFPEARPLTREQLRVARAYCAQHGYVLREVRVLADPEAPLPGARLLQATLRLAECGVVVAQSPTEDELADDHHAGRLWMVLATQRDVDVLENTLLRVEELSEFRVCDYVEVCSEAETPPDAERLSAVPEVEARAPLLSQAPAPHAEPLAPLSEQTVRVSVERLDAMMNLVGELVTERTRLVQVEAQLRTEHGRTATVSTMSELTMQLERIIGQLQQEVMQARMLPIAHLFQMLPRLVRDQARAESKQVDLVIQGEATELDRAVIEVLSEPLIHLIRNAVGHGIVRPEERVGAGKSAMGTVWLSAAPSEGHIIITMRDDGQGVDLTRVRRIALQRRFVSEVELASMSTQEVLNLIFLPGFSTAGEITGVSGRGVGLDVVHTNVKQLGGSVTVDSVPGVGTTFTIVVPLTLAVLETMLVEVGDVVYAIPLTGIVESLYASDIHVRNVRRNPVIRWRDLALPLLPLREHFAHPRLSAPSLAAKPAIVVVNWGSLHAGLVVDRLVGKQEIVVKSLSPLVGNVSGLSGCTLLGDGRVALIVDVAGLIARAARMRKQVSTRAL